MEPFRKTKKSFHRNTISITFTTLQIASHILFLGFYKDKNAKLHNSFSSTSNSEYSHGSTSSTRGGTTRGVVTTFLLSDHFLFSAKKCLYANQRNQDKLLSRKRVYSKHKSIQSLRIPKFHVLKIKNAEVCFENWSNPLQINVKPHFTERKSREDESKKNWRLTCVRSKKIFTG